MQRERVDQIVMSKPAQMKAFPSDDRTRATVDSYFKEVWDQKVSALRAIHKEDQELAEKTHQSDSFISEEQLRRSILEGSVV